MLAVLCLNVTYGVQGVQELSAIFGRCALLYGVHEWGDAVEAAGTTTARR
jgi:hypothetical protein